LDLRWSVNEPHYTRFHPTTVRIEYADACRIGDHDGRSLIFGNRGFVKAPNVSVSAGPSTVKSSRSAAHMLLSADVQRDEDVKPRFVRH